MLCINFLILILLINVSYSFKRDQRKRRSTPEVEQNIGDTKSTGIDPDPYGEKTHFLDFPSSEIEKGPLLDFPDPLEQDWLRRSVSYNLSCKRDSDLKRKIQEAKKIQSLHKPSIAHEVKTQNRILQQAMIYHFIENISIPDHEPLNGWKLLDLSASIFESFCKGGKYLPPQFISNAIYAFKKLHYLTTPGRTEFVTDTQYAWISSMLNKCASESKGFKLYQDPCHEDIIAWKKEKNWLCTPWKEDLNLGAYDPLLDIIWHIYNGVYFYCSRDYFEESYLMGHLYSTAIMDLYTLAIKMRWKHQLESLDFWTRILGPNFLIHSKNVERCAQAAIESNELQAFMPRYASPTTIRPPMANTQKIQTPDTT